MSFWFVVPAAGTGRRFGSPVPKQYLDLAGRKIIEHTLERLLALEPAGIAVAIDAGDTWWETLPLSRHPLVHRVAGGAERQDSVAGALEWLGQQCGTDEWVLVHDVARPCVTTADIVKLLERLAVDEVGGILAAPVSDTVKRADPDAGIEATEDRSSLWTAMTPQMFRLGVLRRAMAHCAREGVETTDEAMAVEQLGLRPRLVEGRRDNIKITTAEDMAIADTILRRQRQLKEERGQ